MIKFKSWGPATYTVGELIEKLQEYPKDLAVIAEWEGTKRAIYGACFTTGEVMYEGTISQALLVDVEELCEEER